MIVKTREETDRLVDEAIRSGAIVRVTYTGWYRTCWRELQPENFGELIGTPPSCWGVQRNGRMDRSATS
jgi:hypothetical protein